MNDETQIMYAMVDENGKTIGYGKIDAEGNLNPVDLDLSDFIEVTDDIPEDCQQGSLKHLNSNPEVIQNIIHNNSSVDARHTLEDDDNDGDDGPPQLEPEHGLSDGIVYDEMSQHGQMRYIDENDEMIDENDYLQEDEFIDEDDVPSSSSVMPFEMKTVEFNFLDSKNICCGLCGEIVPYDLLLTEHLPQFHPEFLGSDGMDFEEVPYENWFRDKLQNEKKHMESGFRTNGYNHASAFGQHNQHQRSLRKVSSVRVCPAEMSVEQLQEALRKKMIEKLGRRVDVTLVDKLHAKCEECGSILSLNKKFEIMHLVRHFNAWHPTTHRCSGTWQDRQPEPGMGKPLNLQDFAVTDIRLEAIENLQCIWCGMFTSKDSVAMHFHEVHGEAIEVPKCRLCIEELVLNARLLEQYGEDFQITMPDESHYNCGKYSARFTSEKKMQEFIDKRIAGKDVDPSSYDPDADGLPTSKRRKLNNSRMQYGKRNKPKRNFVMPQYRQAVPQNSQFVTALSAAQWKCKKCGFIIMAAVMSSGCIQHYKRDHPDDLDDLRIELCKARLERISDGCMEFVHASLIECLMCQVSFALHRPYNMCRAIRHLQKKHGEMMPENHAQNNRSSNGNLKLNGTISGGLKGPLRLPKQILDEQDQEQEEFNEDQMQQLSEEEIEKLKEQYKDLDFDDVRVVHLEDEPPLYILKNKEEPLNPVTTRKIARAIRSSTTQNDPEAQYSIGRNTSGDMEMELLEGENQMVMRNHKKKEISEELYEEQLMVEEEFSLELVDEQGNPIANECSSLPHRTANYNGELEENYEEDELIAIEVDSLEEVREKYSDDETAPVPKAEVYFGRQIYNTAQEEMILRPCPLGYSRRVVPLDECHVMEYFTITESNQFITPEEEFIEEEELSQEEQEKWIASQREKARQTGD